MVKMECKIAKRKPWENFVSPLNVTMDIRFLWQKVNNLRTGRSTNFPQTATTSHIRSILLIVFQNVGNALVQTMFLSRKKYLEMKNLPEKSYQFSEITMSELTDVLRTLKGSTPGRVRITYSMITFASAILNFRLCRLYKKILTPIPKHSKSTISLLPVLSKILEKLIAF